MDGPSANMIWVSDKTQVWCQATVRSTDLNKGEIEVEKIENNTVQVLVVPISSTHPMDPSHLLDLDNLCLMNNMHEAPLLDLLRRRFHSQRIYTLTGNVLISLNPYSTIDGLYENALSHLQLSIPLNGVENSTKMAENAQIKLTPHVFSVANRALSYLVDSLPGNRVTAPAAEVNQLLGQKALLNTERDEEGNQSIVISGESGAGKTENSKYVMSFLIQANRTITQPATAAGTQGTGTNNSDTTTGTTSSNSFTDSLLAVLLESSVVLEAFGNAKTVRNDNSSRFGKYIKLMYSSASAADTDSKGGRLTAAMGTTAPELVSAVTDTFLLEKSRLVSVGKDERNYHIFYQLLRGLPQEDPQLCSELCLDLPVETYTILTQGGCTVVGSAAEDATEFSATLGALRTLQCSEVEVNEVWALLACILHLSSLQCVEAHTVGGTADEPVRISSTTIDISRLGALLGLNSSELLRCLTTQELIIMKRSSIHIKVLSGADVNRNILALVKWMYDKLFAWLVRKINYSHSHLTQHSIDQGTKKFIGILDIFGFEILGINSFEQLCINLTNERLQQQFNETVFVSEQDMYRAEGLQWDNITFRDNQHVIDLISSTKSPQGLLLILEEHCMLNRGVPDDNALLASYDQVHEPLSAAAKAASAYFKPRFKTKGFVVRHFAGEVNYMVEGFLTKNNDAMQDDLVKLLRSSSSPFLRNALGVGEPDPTGPGYLPAVLLEEDQGANGEDSPLDSSPISPASPVVRTTKRPVSVSNKKHAASVTVSSQFRAQLDELMRTLRKTRPHYIKCIKPNTAKAARCFQAELVMEQLRYSGVLEVVRIRREGFPIRMPFREFYRTYNVFALGKAKEQFPGADYCKDDAQARWCCAEIASWVLPTSQYQVGHTLIFLRDDGLDVLAAAVNRFLSGKAVVLQALARGFLAKLHYRVSVASVVLCQSLVRKFIQRRRFKKARRAVICIQWAMLRLVLHKKYLLTRELQRHSATKIQALVRRRRGQERAHLRRCAMWCVQLRASAWYRGMVARRSFLRFKLCALKVQLFFRLLIKRKSQGRKVRAAVLIQSVARMYQQRVTFILCKYATIRVQAMIRSQQAQLRYYSTLITIVRLQHRWRGALQRRRYLLSLVSIILVQAMVRGCLVRKSRGAHINAVIKIQSHIRRMHAERQYLHTLFLALSAQTIVRGFLARCRYCKVQQGVRQLQALARGRQARLQQSQQMFSVILLQSFARRLIAEKLFVRRYMAMVTVQNAMTMWIARRQYMCTLYGIVLIQSAVRGRLARLKYTEAMYATIVIQSFGRMIVAQKQRAFQYVAVLVMQSVGRMSIERERYKWLRYCVIKIQSVMRMRLQILQYNLAWFSLVMLQSWARGVLAKKSYHKTVRQITAIASHYRGWKVKQAYQGQRSAIFRLQKNIRSFLSHLRFKKELMGFHELLMGEEGDGRMSFSTSASGTKAQIAKALRRRPHLIVIRNPWLEYCTAFQSAVHGRDPAVLNQLHPNYRDMFAVNIKGHSSAHYLAERPHLPMLRAILAVLDEYKYVSAGGLRRGLDDDDEGDGWFGKQSESQRVSMSLKQTLNASVGNDTLKQGWLKKKRGGMMWQRRYMVLTEDYIIYYKNEQSLHLPKFAIPLEDLTVTRQVNGKELTFEITSPNMPEKKTMFGASNKKAMQFMADTEQELQEWILPLKVIAGVEEKLRPDNSSAPPIVYVNYIIRQLWAAQTDHKGNTPLHLLASHLASHRPLPNGRPDEAVQLAAWLIEHGCPVNAQNAQGQTALHICATEFSTGTESSVGHRELMRCLILKGADGNRLRDYNGDTALEAISLSVRISQPLKQHLEGFFSARPAKQGISLKDMAGNRLKGYSYLSLYVGRSVITDEDSWSKPTISFSVYNSKGQPIERTQELLHPALSSVDQNNWAASSSNSSNGSSVKAFLRKQNPVMSFYWGGHWHMTTPLQNLEAGSFVLVELRDGDADPTTASTYWTRYAINFSTINSTSEEALPLGCVQNSASAASKRTMLTGPAPTAGTSSSTSSSTGVGMTRESSTGRGTLSSKTSRSTMAVVAERDSADLSGSSSGPEDVPKYSVLVVDCVLYQRDRIVGIDHVLNN